MGQDLRTDQTKISNATHNALLRAEELGLSSIDFPALGTGVGGFPPEQAARIMIDVVKKFLQNSRTLKQVGFVLFDSNTFECFKSELGAEKVEI
jgi:O-acetyl-ADP-ribose deacetylase